MAEAKVEFRIPVFLLELSLEEVTDLRRAIEGRMASTEKYGSASELRNLSNINTALREAANGRASQN